MNNQQCERIIRLYRVLLIVVGTAVVLSAAARVWRQPADPLWVACALFAVIGSLVTTSRMPGVTNIITVSDTFVFLTVMLSGLDAAILVAAIATAAESARHVKRVRIAVFNVAAICCSFFASGSIVEATVGELSHLAHHRATFFRYVFALALFAVTQTIINLALLFFPKFVRARADLRRYWHEDLLPTAITTTVTYCTGVVTAAVVNALVHYFGFWAVGSVVPLMLANYLLYRPYVRNVEAARRHAEETHALHLRTLEAFAAAVDAKDEITHEHVKRVQVYAQGMARLLGLSEAEQQALHAGALLHDIGKIAVPDYILNKPGKLTAAEFDKMKIHTVVGAQILERINFPYPLVPVVRHHHERWDGKGYPDGLRGEEIPLTARILTVVDCFDAVREDRQYRKGLTREEAVALLERDRGTIYDPRLVDLFIANLPQFEEQIARFKQGEQVFMPVAVEETEAIRRATPAAGLMSEKAAETPEYVETILAAHRGNQEFIELYELAQTLLHTLTVSDTLAIVMNKLERIVPFETCAVYLLEADGSAAVARQVAGLNAESFRGRAIRPGDGVTGWVLANNQPFSNTDPKLDLTSLGVEAKGYRTLAVYPLAKDARIFGALAVYSQKLSAYSADQLQSLERVASLTSEALHTALVETERQTRALTDALTGLPNARALAAYLQQTQEQARLNHLKLLLVNVNEFRSVNAEVGLQRGDEILREVGRRLQSQLRHGDHLFRYAGDEFVALLHDLSREQLPEIAHRLEAVVAAYQVGRVSLSVSIGQAEFGADGNSLEAALEAAEQRLQARKLARHPLSQVASTHAPHRGA